MVLLASVAATTAVMAQAPAAPAPAQARQPITQEDIKRLVGTPVTVTAAVAAIDYTQRIVVLRDKEGKDSALHVGEDVQRFTNVKVGDRVTMTYYNSLAVELIQPGESPSDSLALGVVGTTGVDRPGATISAQSRIKATVSAIDTVNQTVTLTGEQGRSVIVKVANKDRLAKVKTGDQIEVIMTAAALVSVEPAK
jgi:hypothetical protein